MFRGSIPALVTPFCEGEIDYSALEKLLEKQERGGSSALVIGGTTGESPTLEQEELEEIVLFCQKRSSLPLILGTGSNSTKKTEEMTRWAKDLGVEAALITIPYYNRPMDEGLLKHFERVSLCKLPFIVYHHPGRTGRRVSGEMLASLMELEYAVGIKDSSGESALTREILARDPTLSIFAGDDDSTWDVLQSGAVGAISVIANVLPREWQTLTLLAKEGRIEEGSLLLSKLKPLLKAIGQETNPIGIKCALALEGVIKNELRLPMTKGSAETEKGIQRELDRFFALSV